MSKKRTLYLAAAIFCLMLSNTLTSLSVAYQPPAYNKNDLPVLLPGTSPLNITIVYIGFDPQCINTTYSTWILARWKPQQVLIPGNDWGINFTFSYKYVFTNETFRNNLETYLGLNLQTISLTNPYYGGTTSNDFYNASGVEEYLYSKLSSINAIPANGYNAVILNLTSGWSGGATHPHYYNMTYHDLDSWAVLYRPWMLGWGGHHRFWFIDVSAGASPNPANPSYSGFGFNPIWNLVNSYPEIGDFRSKKGINFLTEYVSDFISGMINDLFTPDFVYPPRVSDNYNIVIYAFDNRTGYLNESKPLIDTSRILSAFRKLIPYATWAVTVHYISLNGSTDPEPYGTLWSVINSAQFASTESVDLVPIWQYFEANMGAYVTQVPGSVSIPVFVFQFNSSWYFSYEGKGIVRPRPWDPTTVDSVGQLWGISLYSMVLIGHDASDAQSGFGFTETIIHETGHELGLMHPHQYDWLQDFSATAMSYYTYEYAFSQFDNDTIMRGHADYYVIKAQSMMNNATELAQWKQLNSTLTQLYLRAYGNLTDALAKYSLMNYYTAMDEAKQALNLFRQFVIGASQRPPYDDVPPVISSLRISSLSPLETEYVHVNATVSDAISGVKNVTLHYKVDSSAWVIVVMTKLSGNLYNATIPQVSAGSTVQYYISAYDENGNAASTTIGSYIVQALPAESPVNITIAGYVVIGLLVGLAIGLIVKRRPLVR